jgi:hypothetical protein
VVIKSVLECKQTRERRGGRVVIGQGVYTPNGHTQGMHGVYTGMHGHACVALLRAGHHVHSLHHWVRCQTFSTLPAGDRSLLPACCCSMSDHPCRLLAAARSLDHPCRLLAAARSLDHPCRLLAAARSSLPPACCCSIIRGGQKMWGRGHVQKECSCWVSYYFLLFQPPG